MHTSKMFLYFARKQQKKNKLCGLKFVDRSEHSFPSAAVHFRYIYFVSWFDLWASLSSSSSSFSPSYSKADFVVPAALSSFSSSSLSSTSVWPLTKICLFFVFRRLFLGDFVNLRFQCRHCLLELIHTFLQRVHASIHLCSVSVGV